MFKLVSLPGERDYDKHLLMRYENVMHNKNKGKKSFIGTA